MRLLLIKSGKITNVLFFIFLSVLTGAMFIGVSDLEIDGDDHGYFNSAAQEEQAGSIFYPLGEFSQSRPLTESIFLFLYQLWGDQYAYYHWLLVSLHLGAALSVVWMLLSLDYGEELAFTIGILFILNVAHFRAVNWIACMAYPISLTLACLVIVFFVRFIRQRRLSWLVLAVFLVIPTMFSHPGGVFVVPLCILQSLRKGHLFLRVCISSIPLLVVAFLCGIILYTVYADVNQSAVPLTAEAALKGGKYLFWFIGMLLITAHWVPAHLSYEPTYFVMSIVGLGCLGLIFLCSRRNRSLADGAL